VKTIFGARRATPWLRATQAQPVTDALGTRLSGMARTMRQAYLQMFGIPDYERYTEHMASRHPEAPVLSRREFCARSIDRKYARNGPRCC
jgi:uncharacterized short protein YbdD (DUF466 family)